VICSSGTDASWSNPAIIGIPFSSLFVPNRKKALRSTRHFPPNLAGRLIVPQSDKDSVAEQRLVRPTKIGNLGDKLGSHPMQHPMHLGEGQRASVRLRRGGGEDSGIFDVANGASRSWSIASVMMDMPVPTRPA